MANVSEEFKQKLEIVNAAIKGAEEKMASAGACVHVACGDLEWEKYGGANKRFRVLMNERPLIEAPIEARIKGYKQLSKLVEAVFARTKALLDDVKLDEDDV